MRSWNLAFDLLDGGSHRRSPIEDDLSMRPMKAIANNKLPIRLKKKCDMFLIFFC